VELLKQIKPAIASVALLYNPASTPFADLILRAVEPAARSLAVTARSSACRDDADIDAAMKLARDARGGVLVMPEVFTTVHRDAIVPLRRGIGCRRFTPMKSLQPTAN
jgi:putative ABC transport system substrate-binding protein